MYWPGTTAAATGSAGFEAEAARGRTPTGVGPAAPTAVPGPRPASGPDRLIVPVARSRPSLPCADDPDLFFAESPEDVEFAKAMCQGCPVRLRCLTGARERREPWGVWGGELFLRGEVVPRKRPRGRPRKTEVAA